MKLRAFNLIPGLAIQRGDSAIYSVVGSLIRDADLEIVSGRFRSGEPFAFDYNHELDLVGVVIDSSDEDADDLGTELAEGMQEI